MSGVSELNAKFSLMPGNPLSCSKCIRNHETDRDFLHYRLRVGAGMPHAQGSSSGGGDGMFHSTDIGLVHFVFLNSEVFFNIGAHGL